MKRKNITLGIILSFVIATFIGIGANAWPGHMIEWEKTDHGSFCHAGLYNESVGGIVMLTVTPTGNDINAGEEFSVTIAISGFTEAANMVTTVGVSARFGDNDEFFFKVQDLGVDGYIMDHVEIGLDSSGNGNSTATLIFYAPTTLGNYTLIIHATEGGESYPTAKAIDWVETSVEIEVVEAAAAADPGIPGFDIFIIASVALLTAVPIILIIRRKRK
ncbi:hypothetical protein LCGC14_1176670 [marine sediment metagenome]|uniref:Uncharacterized protein n=1 Tax=marine sediment metagenome TaxID=412755 RepID=A0A0F9LT63_9ZZZZ|nr:hypothetical protein [bacterium]